MAISKLRASTRGKPKPKVKNIWQEMMTNVGTGFNESAKQSLFGYIDISKEGIKYKKKKP